MIRMTGLTATLAATTLALGAVLAASPLLAQDNFYAGKRITIIVGAPPSGSYAVYARLVGDHITRHIPGNPTVEYEFRGGGDGGLGTANYMENAAPKDGTFIGITQQTIPVNQWISPGTLRYDVQTWNWIGAVAPIRNMLAMWHTAPAQSVEEAKTNPVRVGATAQSSPMYIVPHMLNRFLGTQFEIITGYDGVAGTNLAMEQGEIHGRGASWISVVNGAPHYIEQNLLRAIVVDGATRDPMIPDAPTMIELAQEAGNEEATQVFEMLAASATFGRSFFMPPGVPQERVEIIRQAFEATMRDPAFLAAAEQQKVTVEPLTAAELEEAVQRLASMPENVVRLAADTMAGR